MRKLILGVAVSLDGFIEGPNGEYDWCFSDQDYGMSAFLKRIDAVFYGRKSYEIMLKEEEKSGKQFSGLSAFVFSNTWTSAPGATLLSGDVKRHVRQIKDDRGKDIWLFGGAELTRQMMNAGLIDELWLAVHPVVLGVGKPLFNGIEKRVKTRLLESRTYSTGLVSLSYEVVLAPPAAKPELEHSAFGLQ